MYCKFLPQCPTLINEKSGRLYTNYVIPYLITSVITHNHSADVYNNIGVILSQENKRNNAIKCFQKAHSIMPDHSPSCFYSICK